jgi:hypothetical protein
MVAAGVTVVEGLVGATVGAGAVGEGTVAGAEVQPATAATSIVATKARRKYRFTSLSFIRNMFLTSSLPRQRAADKKRNPPCRWDKEG